MPDPPNATIASLFDELADLYELDGAVVHRVLAYRNAAKSVREAPRSVAAMTREGKVTELPGIGRTLEEKIEALLETGTIPAVEKLRGRIPAGLIDLTRLPGLGPKRARRLYDELGIDSLESLRAAAEAQKLRDVRGFGAKFEEAVLEAFAAGVGEAPKPRVLLNKALEIGEGIVESLRAHPACRSRRAGRLGAAPGRLGQGPRHHRHGLRPAGAAGRLRRARRHRERRIARRERRAGAHPHGRRRSTCAWSSPTSSATCCSTSPAPRRTTWRCARRRCAAGCTSPSTACSTTPPARRTAARPRRRSTSCSGLPWIPPELRENRGELALTNGELPILIEQADLKGDLHMHTTLSDGRADAEAMAVRARELGLEYIAITDHSATHGFGNHVTPDALRAQIEAVRALDERMDGIRVLIGTETNIGTDGSPDYDDDLLAQLDWVVGSVHTSFAIGSDAMTERMIAAIEHPLIDAIGHPTGRKIQSRAPYAVDVERLIEAAARTGTMLEINSAPDRRDLDDVHARNAAAAGVRIVIDSDAHGPNTMIHTRWGIATARRAWLTKDDVANTLPWEQLAALRKRAR